MWRMQVLAIVAIAAFLSLLPAAASASTADVPVVAAPAPPVLAQQPPAENPPAQLPDRQRVVIGLAGVGLIALVLLSRKWRGKPAFFVTFKKKGSGSG